MFITWKVEYTAPFLFKPDDLAIRDLMFFREKLYSTYGRLIAFIPNKWEHSIDGCYIVHVFDQEVRFKKKKEELAEAGESTEETLSQATLAFHGTDEKGLLSLLEDGPDRRFQVRAYHGPCDLSVTEVWDKAEMFAMEKVKKTGDHGIVILYKVLLGVTEERDVHKRTSEEIPGDTRIVTSEKVQHLPPTKMGNRPPYFQILVRNRDSICPIGYYKLNSFEME